VFRSATIVDPDGYYPLKPTERIVINSRDIKILEIITEPIDNHDTAEEGEDHDTEETDSATK